MTNRSVMGSIADLIDRLSIENIKCYDANRGIITERRGENRAQVIADLEFKARSSGEMRVKLKGEINILLDPEAMVEGRTYDLKGL